MKTSQVLTAAGLLGLTSALLAQEASSEGSLTPLAAHILWENGTERAFTGTFWNHFAEGEYRCVNCDALLFESNQKFESHCGWPSFSDAVAGALTTALDVSHGMRRTV